MTVYHTHNTANVEPSKAFSNPPFPSSEFSICLLRLGDWKNTKGQDYNQGNSSDNGIEWKFYPLQILKYAKVWFLINWRIIYWITLVLAFHLIFILLSTTLVSVLWESSKLISISPCVTHFPLSILSNIWWFTANDFLNFMVEIVQFVFKKKQKSS